MNCYYNYILLLIIIKLASSNILTPLSTSLYHKEQLYYNNYDILLSLKVINNERYDQPTDFDEDMIIDKRKLPKYINQLKGGSIVQSLSFNNYHISLSQLKIILQVVLTIFNFSCWLLPLNNQNLINNKELLKYANIFAGGIFLMLCFDHMIPDSMNILTTNGYNNKLSFYFTLVGFSMILFIEKILFDTNIDNNKNIDTNNNNKINTEKNTKLSPMSAIILSIAISLHSLFETMALGLASDATSAIMLSTSIALHQPAESLALLVAFLKTSMPKLLIMKWLTFCSLVGPVGLLVGILISKLSIPLVEGLVIALTAGTFLYVGASEIVSEEFEDIEGITKYYKFITLISGMLLMGGLHYLTDSFN